MAGDLGLDKYKNCIVITHISKLIHLLNESKLFTDSKYAQLMYTRLNTFWKYVPKKTNSEFTRRQTDFTRRRQAGFNRFLSTRVTIYALKPIRSES